MRPDPVMAPGFRWPARLIRNAERVEQRSGRALGRLLSVRRALWSLAAGVVAGTATALVGAPELTPLVVWTIAAGTIPHLGVAGLLVGEPEAYRAACRGGAALPFH